MRVKGRPLFPSLLLAPCYGTHSVREWPDFRKSVTPKKQQISLDQKAISVYI